MLRTQVAWGDERLAVDLNRGQQPALRVQRRDLDLPYSDLSPATRSICVVALEEILANKWFMLDDRREPRDLYDLWFGICVRFVSLDSVANAFKAKYHAKPTLWRIKQAKKLHAPWEERLAHQVADLPPFKEVFSEVYATARAWEETG
jgi:predicted nucleotidyltransferase component of viral defense system